MATNKRPHAAPARGKRRKKKRRYRVRWGRVFVAVALLVGLIVLCCRACTSCNCGDSRPEVTDASEHVQTMATDRATYDLRRLAAAPEGSSDRERILLEMRALASQLGASGYVRAATIYCDTVESGLRNMGILPPVIPAGQ